jgi:predicted DNA-binding protein with PD1-like motif
MNAEVTEMEALEHLTAFSIVARWIDTATNGGSHLHAMLGASTGSHLSTQQARMLSGCVGVVELTVRGGQQQEQQAVVRRGLDE